MVIQKNIIFLLPLVFISVIAEDDILWDRLLEEQNVMEDEGKWSFDDSRCEAGCTDKSLKSLKGVPRILSYQFKSLSFLAIGELLICSFELKFTWSSQMTVKNLARDFRDKLHMSCKFEGYGDLN